MAPRVFLSPAKGCNACSKPKSTGVGSRAPLPFTRHSARAGEGDGHLAARAAEQAPGEVGVSGRVAVRGTEVAKMLGLQLSRLGIELFPLRWHKLTFGLNLAQGKLMLNMAL